VLVSTSVAVVVAVAVAEDVVDILLLLSSVVENGRDCGTVKENVVAGAAVALATGKQRLLG